MESIKTFKFRRKATLDHLLDKVRKRHYSTFSLYDDRELRACLKEFKRKIMRNFTDPRHIEWIDENIMILLRSGSKINPM